MALGNINGILQSINLASSIVSSKNCSAAPNCATLKRNDCLETVNTCSGCLAGYKGTIGSSNSRCVEISSTTGATGSVCNLDADCLYSHCENGLCTAPQQTCQTSVPGTICSGHGICRSLDSSGSIVQSCTVVEDRCSTSCLCRTGYGGADCSLDTTAMTERSNLRVGMCTGLAHVIAKSQKSAQLFDSIASALLSAYDHTEISGTSELAKCSSIVRFLGTLASRGFMKGTLPATQQIYAEISSQFVGTRVSSNSTKAIKFTNDISSAVSGMTTGIIKGMLEGQSPVTLVTSNIRATYINELASSLVNGTFSSPASDAEKRYGTAQPRIVIVGDGINTCNSGENYAQISTLQFGTNPHLDSDTIKSPLLQFSSIQKVLKKTTESLALIQSNTSNVRNGNLPAYYVILQFSSKQKLNLSIQAGPRRGSNYSFPVCTLYSPSLAKYVSCENCNISSYTNFNVTFGCYDIKNICPANVATRRGLVGDYDGESGSTAAEDVDWDEDEEALDRAFDGVGSSFSSRDLSDQGGDDYIASADDGPVSNDDRFNSKRSESVSEFGTILDAIAAEFASVLSLNPFTIDFAAATPILAFVGTLCGAFLIGLLFFLKWDKRERHDAVYLFDAREREIKKKVAEDLKKGGNGVTFPRITKKKSENNDVFMDIFHLSMTSLVSSDQLYQRKDSWAQFKGCQMSDDGTTLTETDIRNGSLEANILIAQFSNEVLPKTYTPYKGALKFKRGKYKFNSSVWADAFYTLRRMHFLTAMFYRSSLCVSRTLRYLEMCRKVLLYIFIDTVIYGIFFPSDATCTTYVSKAECQSLPSKVRQIKSDNNLKSSLMLE